MFYAINTLRDNKTYRSLQVHNDLSLQETSNNRWIAPEIEIQDWGEQEVGSEVEVTYIKPTEIHRYNENNEINIYLRAAHFRLAKYNSGIKFKKNKDHQRVQNFIFNYILNNENNIILTTSERVIEETKKKFYFHSLNELGLNLNTIDSEVTVKTEDNIKRADIFIEIENKQEIYGKAICIEIQLTGQSKEVIMKRTLDRALLGMSTIWIHKKDLEITGDIIKLKKNEFIIYPYISVLNKHYEQARELIRVEYEKQGILVDNKIDYVKKELSKIIENFNNILTPEQKLCQACLNGVIVRRKRKSDGQAFLACSNRECNNIINLK